MRRGLGWRRWAAIVLALATLAAIFVLIAVVALGILLVLLPAAVLATVIFFFFPSKFRRRRSHRSVTVIDGNFRVVDPAEKITGQPTEDPSLHRRP